MYNQKFNNHAQSIHFKLSNALPRNPAIAPHVGRPSSAVGVDGGGGLVSINWLETKLNLLQARSRFMFASSG